LKPETSIPAPKHYNFIYFSTFAARSVGVDSFQGEMGFVKPNLLQNTRLLHVINRVK